MGIEIILTRASAQALVEQAERAHPFEACGLLLGALDRAGIAAVARILPCANVAADPAHHFEIDPLALIAALKAQRAGGEAVLGYYHSHPSGDPAPSRTDDACAARDGRIWAIIARDGEPGHHGGHRIGWWRDTVDGFVLSTARVDG